VASSEAAGSAPENMPIAASAAIILVILNMDASSIARPPFGASAAVPGGFPPAFTLSSGPRTRLMARKKCADRRADKETPALRAGVFVLPPFWHVERT
jgi:hypothetical protein